MSDCALETPHKPPCCGRNRDWVVLKRYLPPPILDAGHFQMIATDWQFYLACNHLNILIERRHFAAETYAGKR
jgi:hypothetical protein